MSTTAAEVPSSVEAFRVIPNGAPHSDEERADALADLRFGVQFTDHMARITWTDGEGWHDRRVEAYGPLQLDPAAAVLHYGQEVFEGLKAYRWEDGSVWTFRPEANAARLNRSAWRLALPELPGEDFLGAIEALSLQLLQLLCHRAGRRQRDREGHSRRDGDQDKPDLGEKH